MYLFSQSCNSRANCSQTTPTENPLELSHLRANVVIKQLPSEIDCRHGSVRHPKTCDLDEHSA